MILRKYRVCTTFLYPSSKRWKNSTYCSQLTEMYPRFSKTLQRTIIRSPNRDIEYIYNSSCFHPYLELTEGTGSDFEDFIQARTSKRDRENLITRSLRSRKGWLGSRACRPGARNLVRLSAPWMEARHIKMIPVQFSGFHSSRTSRHSINMVFVRLNRAVKSSYYSTNALIKSQRRVGRGGGEACEL